jgi:hypothetical protein
VLGLSPNNNPPLCQLELPVNHVLQWHMVLYYFMDYTTHYHMYLVTCLSHHSLVINPHQQSLHHSSELH